MQNDTPEFGKREQGREYRPRPGAYAVIVDDRQRIALVRTPGGLFLPGGGLDRDESVEDGLTREVREESGWSVIPGEALGTAIEYASLEGEGRVAKKCTFLTARFDQFVGGQVEADHALEWHSLEESTRLLTHASQSWAVRQFIDREQMPSRK